METKKKGASYEDYYKNLNEYFQSELSHKENMKLYLEHKKPVWMPDLYNESVVITSKLVNEKPAGKSGHDWFGVSWIYDTLAEAVCPEVGKHILEDVCDWREIVKFPNLDDFDWKADGAVQQMRAKDYPDRMTLFRGAEGPFERLHSLMGFENAFCALMMEPEETFALMDAIADFKIEVYKKIFEYYGPIDIVVSPDDWGTQLAGFFSKEMYQKQIMPHTKKIVDFVKSQNVYYIQHSCGNNEAYIEDMVSMGVDAWEAQENCNNITWIAENFGDRIGINLLSALDRTFGFTQEERDAVDLEAGLQYVHNFIDKYGKTGKNGCITSRVRMPDSNVQKACAAEFYEYSKKIYSVIK